MKMALIRIALLMFCLWPFVSVAADLGYIKADKSKGTLTSTMRQGSWYVSARQFCFAFGCRVFYQWANHRVVIQNTEQRGGAIVSSLTRLALVDGKVLDFKGRVLSEIGEGYLL